MPDGRGSLRSTLHGLEREAPSIGEEATLRQNFVAALDDFLRGSLLNRRGVHAVLDQRIVRGKPDARVGGLLFEVKLPSPRGPGIEAAIAQASDYLHEFHQRHQRPARAVAYDGLSLAFLEDDGTVIRRGRPSALATVLESWLIGLGSDIITPDDFVARLGPASPRAHEVMDVLWRLFQGQRGQNRFIEEVFQVWRGLYGVTTNLSDEAIRGLRRAAESIGITISGSRAQAEEFLFIVESYLAVLLKLLVARVVVQQRLTDYPTLEALLTAEGSPVRGMEQLEQRASHVQGVFEEDVFLWPVHASIFSREAERELEGVLGSLATDLDDVDLVGARHDFLRLVYQQFLDPVSRRTLGEFYTTEELVKETLDAVGYNGDLSRRIMDISCGSGTFLVEAISRAVEQHREAPVADLVHRITGNIIGVDIHPFAVAMARVNYLIAISGVLEASEAVTFAVPVYWADSLARLRPQQPSMAGMRPPIPINLPNLPQFRLPDPRDVDWGDLFRRVDEAVDRVSRVQRGTLDPQAVWAYFWSRADQEHFLPHEQTLRDFISTVVSLHNGNRDMRWVPLLRNILAVAQYQGSCDYIVGNPPWVRIHNISPAIRERLFGTYQTYRDAGWRRGASLGGLGRGFARQVDYAVAFVERGLEFLTPGGRLGFVITSKIMHALYGSALRKKLLQEAPPIRLVDYSLQARPVFQDATNYPLVLAIEKRPSQDSDATSITVVSPRGERQDFTLPSARLPLLASDREAPWALVPPRVREAFDRMLTGEEGRPRRLLGEIQGFQAQMGVKTALNKVFLVKRVEPVPEAPDEVVVYTEGYYSQQVPENQKHLYSARVEKILLRPVVRGADVEAWRYRQQDYILWTHDDETGHVLQDISPKGKAYFQQHVRALRRRDDYHEGMPIWTVFRVRPDKVGPKLVWQRISNDVETLFLPPNLRTDIVESGVIPIDTVRVIALDQIRGPVVAAFLNSLPVGLYCLAFSRRDRGAYRDLDAYVIGLVPLPGEIQQFLENATGTHAIDRLMTISQALHENPQRSDRPALEAELDSIVAGLYGLTLAQLQAMREFYTFITPSRPVTEVRDLEAEEALEVDQ